MEPEECAFHISPKRTKSNFKKNTEQGNKRSRIVWDELNLITNEANKSSTMKIDEPKTPFNRDYIEDEEGEFHSQSPRGSPSKGIQWNDLESSLNRVSREEEKVDQETSSASERDEEISSRSDTEDDSEEESKKTIFKSKRKDHYNEFQAMKQWKNKEDPL